MDSKHSVGKPMENRDYVCDFSAIAGKVASIYHMLPRTEYTCLHVLQYYIFNTDIPICIKFNFI